MSLKILDQGDISGLSSTRFQPRAVGDVTLSVKATDRGTRLAGLRQAGSLKALFPANAGGAGACLAVLVNTAGGVTGGDRFSVQAEAGPATQLAFTTQAAERAYRAAPGPPGQIRTRLVARDGARLNWLPQETLIFDGSSLDRCLDVQLFGGASALIVEPLVFGRAAMGETVTDGRLCDRIQIRRDGELVVLDQLNLSGDIARQLARPAVAGGAIATANLLFLDPAAEARLPQVRALLPNTGGASLRAPNVLAVRLVAPDSYLLRKTLVPILTLLSGNDIPRPWMI